MSGSSFLTLQGISVLSNQFLQWSTMAINWDWFAPPLCFAWSRYICGDDREARLLILVVSGLIIKPLLFFIAYAVRWSLTDRVVFMDLVLLKLSFSVVWPQSSEGGFRFDSWQPSFIWSLWCFCICFQLHYLQLYFSNINFVKCQVSVSWFVHFWGESQSLHLNFIPNKDQLAGGCQRLTLWDYPRDQSHRSTVRSEQDVAARFSAKRAKSGTSKVASHRVLALVHHLR